MSDERIVMVSIKDNSTIEDLFSLSDFNQFILEDPKNSKQEIANSLFIKEQKIDKILLAKKFFDQVKNDKSAVNLSPETSKEFSTIFGKISKYFSKGD
jgi:hypothetical protein